MYNFSGIIHRIWSICGLLLLLGIVGILIDKYQAKQKGKEYQLKNSKISLITIVLAVGLCLFFICRIIFPNVSSYTGVFQYEKYEAQGPLLSKEYVFWNGGKKNQVFYLDVYSKKKIFPEDFEEAEEYIIYYDELTKIIVGVERVE